MKVLILLIVPFFISACSSTGVSLYRGDAYKVEVTHVLPSSAKKEAYEEATNYCSAKEKEMEVISEPDQESERYEIIFHCV